jgi:hypothetical protein
MHCMIVNVDVGFVINEANHPRERIMQTGLGEVDTASSAN